MPKMTIPPRINEFCIDLAKYLPTQFGFNGIRMDLVRSPKVDSYLASNSLRKPKLVVTSALSRKDSKQIFKIIWEKLKPTKNIFLNYIGVKLNFLEDETWVIKNGENKFVGFYKLDLIENDILQIGAIGIKKELRKTKSAYEALKLMDKSIKEFATKHNVKKVTLYVNTIDKLLIKMYKKLGFEIKSTIQGYYGNYSAYYMEADVAKVMKQANRSC